MTLERIDDVGTDRVRFVLTFEGGELADAHRLARRRGDRLLLDECDGDDATLADRMLGLEVLVRRCEEAAVA